jgi:hypothetical protein
LADLKVELVSVEPGSAAIGKSAIVLNLRRTTGASVVAVARGAALIQPYTPAIASRLATCCFSLVKASRCGPRSSCSPSPADR